MSDSEIEMDVDLGVDDTPENEDEGMPFKVNDEIYQNAKTFFEEHGGEDGTLGADLMKELMDELTFKEWTLEEVEDMLVANDSSNTGNINFLDFITAVGYPQPAPTDPNAPEDGEVVVAVAEPSGPFVDKDFVAGVVAIGEDHPLASELPFEPEDAHWIRMAEIAGPPHLFDNIQPNNIAQGMLGDSWLLSALACLAEFPGAVQQLFLTKQVAEDGKYELQLFNPESKDWEKVVIDDLIPCFSKTTHYQPCFSRPRDNEYWVLLLEKAFAKWVGNYAALSGGLTNFAWILLTGCTDQWAFEKDVATGEWEHTEYTCTDSKNPQSLEGEEGLLGGLDEDTLWGLVRTWDKKNYMFAGACLGDTSDAPRKNGLVPRHAYSIIQVRHVEADGEVWRMINLRNPWGDREWNGRFSDEWAGWAKCPQLKKLLNIEAKDDGLFWMEWEDFEREFGIVFVNPKTMNTPRGKSADIPGGFKKNKRSKRGAGFFGKMFGC